MSHRAGSSWFGVVVSKLFGWPPLPPAAHFSCAPPLFCGCRSAPRAWTWTWTCMAEREGDSLMFCLRKGERESRLPRFCRHLESEIDFKFQVLMPMSTDESIWRDWPLPISSGVQQGGEGREGGVTERERERAPGDRYRNMYDAQGRKSKRGRGGFARSDRELLETVLSYKQQRLLLRCFVGHSTPIHVVYVRFFCGL